MKVLSQENFLSLQVAWQIGESPLSSDCYYLCNNLEEESCESYKFQGLPDTCELFTLILFLFTSRILKSLSLGWNIFFGGNDYIMLTIIIIQVMQYYESSIFNYQDLSDFFSSTSI